MGPCGFDPTDKLEVPMAKRIAAIVGVVLAIALPPSVDETLWRTQIKNNLSIVAGRHTFKVGGEWLHTVNDQVFRGFFSGRYIFGSVSGFLRYASPAGAGGVWPKRGGGCDR